MSMQHPPSDDHNVWRPPLPPRPVSSTKQHPTIVAPRPLPAQRTILLDAPTGTDPLRYQSSNHTLAPPSAPSRPLSAPPGEVPLVEHYDHPGQVDGAELSQSPSATSSSASSQQRRFDEDERQSSGAKRFIGNMLVVRLGRAGVQSVTSTVKLPMYLSPWGDNVPWSLPNVRKRDLALATVAHFGVGALFEGSLDAIIEHGVSWTAEQTADQSIDKMQGPRPHQLTRRVGVTSVEVRIKHKLIGEQSEMRFFEERDSVYKMSCAKGWFCPYLYASGRTVELSRLKEFSMAELLGPGLKADAALAPVLLSGITEEDAPVCQLCPSDTSVDHLQYQRLAVFFLGISPYRTAHTWSQARVPNQARLKIHLLTHVPAIVLPVNDAAPVCCWSPWTMKLAIEGKEDYSADRQHIEIMRYLESITEPGLMEVNVRANWRNQLSSSLQEIINGIRNMPNDLGSLIKDFEAERAGIVMFRF